MMLKKRDITPAPAAVGESLFLKELLFAVRPDELPAAIGTGARPVLIGGAHFFPPFFPALTSCRLGSRPLVYALKAV
ncbi:MAG TPA: hypothetical protein VGB05_04720, partial [Pyrinomonadaceae bacterium]